MLRHPVVCVAVIWGVLGGVSLGVVLGGGVLGAQRETAVPVTASAKGPPCTRRRVTRSPAEHMPASTDAVPIPADDVSIVLR